MTPAYLPSSGFRPTVGCGGQGLESRPTGGCVGQGLESRLTGGCGGQGLESRLTGGQADRVSSQDYIRKGKQLCLSRA